MPESTEHKKIFTLLEVTKSIRLTLEKRYTSAFWVKAEMIKLNYYSHSGHCYPDLVEKQDGKVIAQIRSNLWKADYNRVNENFIRVLKEPLKDGIKILFLAKISFDPVYGISLRIIDIDPSFTLGDLEKEKQETIFRLQKEGLFEKNKTLPFPLLPQRLAIISVETSKGYADFLRVIENNPWNYKFFHVLFPSILQGEKAIEAISAQLRRIKKVQAHFDLVAIIRGGGGDVGLSCYNDYSLAREISGFPLPVITGIGHATNETVAEMIAFENAITPTKLAEFLIQHFHNFSQPVQEAERIITDHAVGQILDEKSRLHSELKLFRSVTKNILNANKREIISGGRSISQNAVFLFRNQHKILSHVKFQTGRQSMMLIRKLEAETGVLWQNCKMKSKNYLKNEGLALSNLEKNIEILDPKNVLKRGYSMTLKNGKSVTSGKQIMEGDQIETILLDEKIVSIVKSKKNNDQ